MTDTDSPAAAEAVPEPDVAEPPAPTKPRNLVSGGVILEWHLAPAPVSAARDASRSGLVLVHPLPTGTGAASAAFSTFPELADRVARDTGWSVLAYASRGAGRSPGQFSPATWLEDIRSAVAFLRHDVESVWVAGFGFGGTLALRAGADDASIGGVAVLAAPSQLATWVDDPEALAVATHEAGLTPTATPDDLESWAGELRAIDPLGAAEEIPPRPLLIVHGSADETVPPVDARAISDAAAGEAELRVIAMAGHRLRHDPRAIAVLLGWLQRRAN